MLLAVLSHAQPQHVRFTGLPADISSRHVFVVDLTMRQASQTLAVVKHLQQQGVPDDQIVVVTFVATAEAVDALCKHSKKLNVVCAAMDVGVDAERAMVPGMGAFSTRWDEAQ